MKTSTYYGLRPILIKNLKLNSKFIHTIEDIYDYTIVRMYPSDKPFGVHNIREFMEKIKEMKAVQFRFLSPDMIFNPVYYRNYDIVIPECRLFLNSSNFIICPRKDLNITIERDSQNPRIGKFLRFTTRDRNNRL